MTTAHQPTPHYGDIYNVDLDRVRGSEIGKRRSAVIAPNDSNNERAETVSVVPITSRPARRVYPFEVLLPQGVGGLTASSRAKCDQIRTVSKSRLGSKWGALPAEYLRLLRKALAVHLNMA